VLGCFVDFYPLIFFLPFKCTGSFFSAQLDRDTEGCDPKRFQLAEPDDVCRRDGELLPLVTNCYQYYQLDIHSDSTLFAHNNVYMVSTVWQHHLVIINKKLFIYGLDSHSGRVARTLS